MYVTFIGNSVQNEYEIHIQIKLLCAKSKKYFFHFFLMHEQNLLKIFFLKVLSVL